jgi:hypothetical protein
MLWVDSHLSASKLPSTHLLASEKGFRCDVGSILGFTVIGAHIEWNDGPHRPEYAGGNQNDQAGIQADASC